MVDAFAHASTIIHPPICNLPNPHFFASEVHLAFTRFAITKDTLLVLTSAGPAYIMTTVLSIFLVPVVAACYGALMGVAHAIDSRPTEVYWVRWPALFQPSME